MSGSKECYGISNVMKKLCQPLFPNYISEEMGNSVKQYTAVVFINKMIYSINYG